MLYIFDQNEQLQAVLRNDGTACPYYDAIHTEKLTGENTFTFTVPADHPDAQFVTEGNLVAFKDLDQNWQLFEIKRITDIHEDSLTKIAYCEHAFYELIDDFIEDIRPYDVSAHFALTQALSGTRWSVGDVADLGLNSTNFYYESVLSAVQKVASVWKGELRFRVVVEGGVISARYVDLLARRGADTGKQFVYSKDIKSIEREVDLTTLVTALYGRGKGVEVGEGYGRRLDFADVVWSVDNGDPVDKPAGQEWVGDPEALARWGRPGGRHRFDVFEDPEETYPEVLLQKTWEALQERKNPRITYNLDVADLERLTGYEHEKVRLGDTVRVIDRAFSPALLVEARVIEINRDILQPENTKITLGNFAPTIADENLKIQETMQTVRDRQGVWDEGGEPFTGPVPTSWLEGIIDTLQNEVRAGNGSVTLTNDNGIMIVDDPENPTKALRLLGGLLAISNEKDPVTGDWVWRTFGTGDGFTADLLNAGQIRTSLVQILGNSHFYWDGDYLYIVNPDDGNQQIRLSKEGIRFTRDGGQTWLVAMDFDGIRMEGQSQDGYTHYVGDGVRVYDEQGNLVGHLGSFETPSGQTATFTRNSVAYKQNGQRVAAGQPRFEQGKFDRALLVEEGTTNVFGNSGRLDTDSNGDGLADNVVIYTLISSYSMVTDSWLGTKSQRAVSSGSGAPRLQYNIAQAVSAGQVWSVSIRGKAQAGKTLFLVVRDQSDRSFAGSTKTQPATGGWDLITLTFTIPSGVTSIKVQFGLSNAVAGDWFQYCALQLEQKPYATSFVDGTRSPEPLAIPTAGVLNPQEGTIELLAYIDPTGRHSADTDFSFLLMTRVGGSWANRISVRKLDYSTQWDAIFGDTSGNYTTLSFGQITERGWYRFALTWKATRAAIFLNGVLKAETSTPNLPSVFDATLSVGTFSPYGTQSYELNSLIDDLRISNRARTDEEILAAYQSGRPLPVDEWTTWKSSFDGHLRNEVPARKYGLMLKHGTIRFDAPSPDEGILIYDTQGNLRTHIGQYARGKYGAKVINGEIYSTLFQTGEEGASDYIKLSSGNEPLLVVNNNKDALSIWASNKGGYIQFFDPSADDMRGQIWPHDDLDGEGLRVEARNRAVGLMDLSLSSANIEMHGNVWVNDNLRVFGDFMVVGSKDAVVPTENYGARALSALEMPETKFMDEGIGEIVNGVCRIDIDPIFLETIEPNTTETPFIVHLTPYDWLDLRVKEIGDTYFIVEEREGLSGKFSWQLSATRKGYAGERMRRVDDDEGLLTSNWEDDLNEG